MLRTNKTNNKNKVTCIINNLHEQYIKCGLLLVIDRQYKIKWTYYQEFELQQRAAIKVARQQNWYHWSSNK